MILIETPRLIIRCMKMSDLSDSFEHRSCADVNKFITVPLTYEQTKVRLEQAVKPWYANENEKLGLAIELKKEKKLIGELMFKYTNLASSVGEVGYRLNNQYQKCGYAFEAVHALYSHLFQQMNVHKLTAQCLVDNDASWKLMEKLGMKKEGTLRAHYKISEKWFDGFCYGILNKEFNFK
ncbi:MULTISPECIES: GNAT family N-acetyltransferase [unclassified Pseudoalteromonas]|uniref:GNAT family N-acetyltransferase n=1 Tax=unclassified Pseudoalteromonas TaxID=194690 RepID=UPI0006941D69|nr:MULTISPECIES: GNAT family protein [unclassified Pseudoalteromonas]